jgi:hypothetical protein
VCVCVCVCVYVCEGGGGERKGGLRECMWRKRERERKRVCEMCDMRLLTYSLTHTHPHTHPPDMSYSMLDGPRYDGGGGGGASLGLGVDAGRPGLLSSAPSPNSEQRTSVLRFSGLLFETLTPEAFLANVKVACVRVTGLQISQPPLESSMDLQLSGTRQDLRQAQHLAAELCSSSGVGIQWMDDVTEFPTSGAFAFDAMNGTYIPFPGPPSHMEVKWLDLVLTGTMDAFVSAGVCVCVCVRVCTCVCV